jgi:hypothetical protein
LSVKNNKIPSDIKVATDQMYLEGYKSVDSVFNYLRVPDKCICIAVMSDASESSALGSFANNISTG